MTASNRPLALVGVLIVEAILAIPITFALGLLGLYFVGSASGALVTGVLGVSGVYRATGERPLYILLVLAPASLAIGVSALAVLGGYFWLMARTARGLRR